MLRTLFWRFAVPILIAIGATAWLAAPYAERLLTEWFRSDIDMRARLVMSTMQEDLTDLARNPSRNRYERYLNHAAADERLLAILICAPDGKPLYQTPRTPSQVSCEMALGPSWQQGIVLRAPQGSVHVSRFDMQPDGVKPYSALLVHDLSFVDRRSDKARNFLIAFVAMVALLVAMLGVFIAWLLLRGWVSALVHDIRTRQFVSSNPSEESAQPVLSLVRQVMREIEENQRMEFDYRENWTPQALQHVVQQLGSPLMLVVSNREPYIHNRDKNGNIVVQMPASGMVTALEPIIRACSGTWIAHGGGSADRDVTDGHDRVPVPPDEPSYTLRRVWLSSEEEDGYYYGFSNEGMWPLCHLAYVRPAFRASDWETYVAVNNKFAHVVKQEANSAQQPIVLVQDYHFALLPGMVRERIPQATIVMFWHIPWPNAETFGICPWKEELLRGMLMADILGFHTRYHCQNFLATVDRFVECQIDHEHMTVTIHGHICHIAHYPISIEWPPQLVAHLPSTTDCAAHVRARFGIAPDVRIGIGVERWDFTKGIVERFHAFKLLLDKYPQWRGKVSLLQIAAPSRSKLPAYRALQDETMNLAEQLNAEYGNANWKPIVLIGEYQQPAQVFELYRAADFCLVNSLHDGMNLVAKEFVSARDDEDGVLILSTFAGASRELIEALLINPYDLVGTADAIDTALRMDREERRERMRLMRRVVSENNIYRWAGRMLTDAVHIRQRRRLLSGSVRPRNGIAKPPSLIG